MSSKVYVEQAELLVKLCHLYLMHNLHKLIFSPISKIWRDTNSILGCDSQKY